jgi:redox-regulated HSP33 family molecular chaperone
MIETTPHNTLAQARNTIQLERLTALKQIIANAGNDAKVKAYVTAELDRMEQDEIAKGQ